MNNMSVKSARTIKTEIWCAVLVLMVTAMVEVAGLNGDHVCMVQQKYNITKRVKYRAPMSVRTYEWCFAMPPRCSKWNTEMRDLTRLETEERTAEVAVCCPGYKMKDVSCVPICPAGKTGNGCSEDCPKNKWGPNCVYECKRCTGHGTCSPVSGRCLCQEGWQGERCEINSSTPLPVEELTINKQATKPTMSTDIDESTVPSPPVSTSVTTTASVTSTTVSTSASPTTLTSNFLTTLAAAKTTTMYVSEPPIRVNTESTTMSSMSTTKPPTEVTSLPTSTLETLQTARIATVDTKEVKPLLLPTTMLALSNVTLTTPWTSSINTYTTTTPVLSTMSTKAVPLKTKEEAVITTVHTTVAPVKTVPTSLATAPVPRTEATTGIEARTTTSKAPKENLITDATFKEVTRKPDTTIKIYPTTIKFKPKEIWIKPAQKEPEHITAVMGEKGAERSSVDLISVISIAGGVMMTVITVAVVIVMLERCKRPQFEDGKMNNIRMQVMIDNNDGPPPYVRSIFNTPLPDPPSTEKCHYQPISTLDRNLKQFMRPVVVQTISPMMLENFRGILECHYDHLPRRSIEFQTLQHRRSMAPSLGGFDEPRQQRSDSLAESTIEALKCEAKQDVIDNTTSEPLYAEIPCWRPPSEHAIEIVNLNGEAVTEL